MRIVVTGASGQLGSYLVRELAAARHDAVGWSRATTKVVGGVPIRPVHLADPHALNAALDETDPDVLIHAGAISSAAAAFADPSTAARVNVASTRMIAQWASARGRRLVFTSTDLVFDGARSWYTESDPANPVILYGQTKRAAEKVVLDTDRGVVARLGLLYGHSLADRAGFFDQAIGALRAGKSQAFFIDEFRTPLDYGTAARILVRLAESDHSGVLHIAGPERLSRFELMRRVAAASNIPLDLVVPGRTRDVGFPEPRPADVSLDTTRLRVLFPDLTIPSVEKSLG